MVSYSANLNAHKADLYGKHGTFSYDDQNIAPILTLLDLQKGEHILDLGCGDGYLTHKLALLVGDEGSVIGTDSNAEMLAKAETLDNLKGKTFQSDAQDLVLPSDKGFENSFDAVFTNATLHWCKRDPAGVLDGAKRSLKKSSKETSTGRAPRFVGEFGGFLNVTGVRSHLHQVLKERSIDPAPLDPWYFPTEVDYRQLLESKGFTVEHVSLNPRITHLKTDLYGWLETFARRSFLSNFEDDEAREILLEVMKRSELDTRNPLEVGKPFENSEGQWSVMYVRLRFVATIEQD